MSPKLPNRPHCRRVIRKFSLQRLNDPRIIGGLSFRVNFVVTSAFYTFLRVELIKSDEPRPVTNRSGRRLGIICGQLGIGESQPA